MMSLKQSGIRKKVISLFKYSPGWSKVGSHVYKHLTNWRSNSQIQNDRPIRNERNSLELTLVEGTTIEVTSIVFLLPGPTIP